MSYQIAVIGFGNVGKNAVNAALEAPDMELAGIVVRTRSISKAEGKHDCPVVDCVSKLEKVDGALLCLPSTIIPEVAPQYLRRGIATADSYDIHGQPLLEMLDALNTAAREGRTASVSGAGWDPGTDSIVRALFQIIAPQGLTDTNFGPGMSMGHTVAVKAIDGVQNALSMTIPKGRGVHDRHVYVELEPGADFEAIKERILTDPYFRNDETVVSKVDDVSALQDMGHGVHMQRHGVASGVHNQCMDFSCRITNPAVTAQVMVAALRGALRQQPGAYVMLGLPILDFLPGDRRQLVKDLC